MSIACRKTKEEEAKISLDSLMLLTVLLLDRRQAAPGF
jgi:hypothetical protein